MASLRRPCGILALVYGARGRLVAGLVVSGAGLASGKVPSGPRPSKWNLAQALPLA